MKRLIPALLSVVFLCAANLEAAPITFQAILLGTNENPPNISPGTGIATLTYDSATHTYSVSATWQGLMGLTTVAHIHCCTVPTSNVVVATFPGTFPGFPAGLTSGSYTSGVIDLTNPASFTAAFLTNSGGGAAAAEAALLAGLLAGQAYFNIHTTSFPGGEIRGTLVQTQVPEPTTIGLFAIGLAGLALARTRRKA